MRVVVAGFGNVLRADDGFGVEVIRQLQDAPIPDGVELLDVGIGGIHLVQVLADPADGLIVLDALAEVDRTPGTILVIEPHIIDVDAMSPLERRDQLADMHYATPDRALMLANAVGVLPPQTLVVGVVPEDADSVYEGLSEVVVDAIPFAIAEVRRIVSEFGVPWEVHPAS